MKKFISAFLFFAIMVTATSARAIEAVAYWENNQLVAEQPGIFRVIGEDGKCYNAIGLRLVYMGQDYDRAWFEARYEVPPRAKVDCGSFPTEKDGLVFQTGLIPEIRGTLEYYGEKFWVRLRAIPINIGPLPPGRWVLEEVRELN